MSIAFPELAPNQQRGSKPRCHLLTHGAPSEIAARLTSIIEPWGAVRSTDRWMPAGFERCAEAQLHSASEILPQRPHRDILRDWWLAISSGAVSTPNIDIASTCLVQGKEGILLIEAKAHDYELRIEERGKSLAKDCSDNSRKNHEHIGRAIKAANRSLSAQTNLLWSLSRDMRYQMSNRFAWAWKLTELGIPTILVYLGFTGCEEMREQDIKVPLANREEWEQLVRSHSTPLFPDEVWNRQWRVHGQPFIPLIRTSTQPLAGCDHI